MEDSADCDKRPKFGNRHLDNDADVYQHNAWDNVQWDDEFRKEVIQKIDENASVKVTVEEATELDENADQYWDKFYNKHENKFFKDRHWLFTEFPELLPSEQVESTSKTVQTSNSFQSKFIIFELGSGCGNTVNSILKVNQTDSLFVYCCDFSPKAIELVKQNPLYNDKRCHAFVFDVTTSDWSSMPFAPGSLDIVTMVFVLSAIDPLNHKQIIANIKTYLKPTGTILFRDYGYCDLTQTRFKSGRCIKDNFYVRGDGTRSFFFNEKDVDKLFSDSGFRKVDLHIDQRLQVNRASKKKMYRVWIQAKYENTCHF